VHNGIVTLEGEPGSAVLGAGIASSADRGHPGRRAVHTRHDRSRGLVGGPPRAADDDHPAAKVPRPGTGCRWPGAPGPPLQETKTPRPGSKDPALRWPGAAGSTTRLAYWR
jgi:hypothetical protein